MLEQASRQDDTSEIILNQAADLEYAGKMDQALKLYRQVWDKSKDPGAANNVAYMIIQLFADNKDKLAEAKQLIEQAVAQRKDSPDFRDTLGWISYLQGNCEQACMELRKAVKGLPQSAEVHYHLGMAESACGRLDLARWHLAAAVNVGKAAQAQKIQMAAQTTQAIALAAKALAALGPAK